jgi:hypothetical protein
MVSSQVMGFPSGYIYLVRSTLHSVFLGLVVRVCYVHTHLLGFQQHSGSHLALATISAQCPQLMALITEVVACAPAVAAAIATEAAMAAVAVKEGGGQ